MKTRDLTLRPGERVEVNDGTVLVTSATEGRTRVRVVEADRGETGQLRTVWGSFQIPWEVES